MYKKYVILKDYLSNNNIVGLESIYYCIFFISILKTDIFKKYILDYKNIIDVQAYFNKTHNIFNKTINLDNTIIVNLLKLINSNIVEFIDININTLINDIFNVYLTNENLLDIKHYIKYYNNIVLNKWIYNLVDSYDNKSIFEGNIKINSLTDLITTGSKFGSQINEYIYEINLIQNFINNNSKIVNINNIISNNIQLNNSLFDIIFFDFPNDIHNIIYTQCCDQIKNLKIRGTKYECLLLQLITTLLKVNGEAILIIPESILYCNSKQYIETRKYIFNNFNIEKIIHINQNIYYNNINRDLKSITNTIKNCIFYFKNTGKTNIINISEISLVENKIIETNLNNINNINNNYSFYFKDYLSVENDLIETKKVDDIFKFYDNTDYIKLNNTQFFILLNKYYNNSFIKITNEYNNNNNNYYLIYNEDKSMYNTYYLENVLKRKTNLFIKGVNNEFDLSKIKEYNIPTISINKQKTICNYIETSNQIIKSNEENILRYTQLKTSILDNIPTNKMIILMDIITIIEKNINEKMISILKNGIYAGNINYYQGELNNNSYYFTSGNHNFILLFIFYYLKYIELEIKRISNLTKQPNLIKSNLLNINIPNISIESQKEVIKACIEIDNNIDILILNNKNINEKDIFEIITTINCQ